MARFHIHDDDTVSLYTEGKSFTVTKKDILDCAREFAIRKDVSLLDEELKLFMKAYHNSDDFIEALQEKAIEISKKM